MRRQRSRKALVSLPKSGPPETRKRPMATLGGEMSRLGSVVRECSLYVPQVFPNVLRLILEDLSHGPALDERP